MNHTRFNFEPANPVSGRRGIDANARMWIRIDVAAAIREAVASGRPFSFIPCK